MTAFEARRGALLGSGWQGELETGSVLNIPESHPPDSPIIDSTPSTVPVLLIPGLDRREPVRSNILDQCRFVATSTAFAALASTETRDIVHLWPHPIPDTLIFIPHAGNKSNPYETLPHSSNVSGSTLPRSILVLARTLSGVNKPPAEPSCSRYVLSTWRFDTPSARPPLAGASGRQAVSLHSNLGRAWTTCAH
jgi:hypothetical protein